MAEAPSLRVAVLSHGHPSLSKGGAEIAAHTLFVGLRAIGIDAIFVAACEEQAADRIDLGAHEYALRYAGGMYDAFYHLSPAGVREELVDLLRREGITVLSAHHFLHVGVGAFRDVAAAGIETVFTFHEFLAICHNHGQMVTRGPQQLLCDGPSPAACRGCYPEHTRQQFAVRARHFVEAMAPVAAFVSPSRFLADRMIANGYPAERMHVIENGIPHRDPVPPAGPRPAERPWTYGYFGQITPFKGMGVILGACAIIARDPALAARVRVAVHGNFVGQSQAFVDRFTAAVEEHPFLTYLGPYDNARVGGLMAACDYVVAPSSWWENSPVVIQEAYHARRPVLCTGIGGMAEKVVDGVTGLHFARNDAADLAGRIAQGADAALHARLQAAIPDTSTPEAMARAYAAVFAEAGAAALTPSDPPRPA